MVFAHRSADELRKAWVRVAEEGADVAVALGVESGEEVTRP